VIWIVIHLLYKGCVTYRLGDFIRQVGIYQYTVFRMYACILQRSDTIIRRYGYSRHAKDLDYLLEITQSDLSIPCAIHVRTGEVIDNNTRTVDTMWFTPDTHFTPNDPEAGVVGRTAFLGNTPVLTRGYVKSRFYYENVCRELKTRNIVEIHLSCGGIRVDNQHKSQEYVYRLKTLFTDHGFHIVDISSKTADEAFQMMSNAVVFVPSGGGYSTVIASLVTKRKHEVLKPIDA
jgi:hypothetical protein